MLQEQQEHTENRAVSFFTSFKKLAVATIRIANPFTLPRRVAKKISAFPKIIYKRLEEPLRFAAIPVVREDGAIKKRFLALGGISPSPPVARLLRLGASATRPHHRALINVHRRSPNIDESIKNGLLELGYELPPDTPSPLSTALLIPVHGLPYNNERPTQHSPDIWSPTPTGGRLAPIAWPNFHAATATEPAEDIAQHVVDDIDMDIWPPTPTGGRLAPIAWPNFHAATATEPAEDITQHADDDVDMSDSLDFSFSDILTSTPPRTGLTQSQSPIALDSPSIYAEESPRISAETSPSTPISQNLLKMQLRRGAALSDIEEESETEATKDQDSDLPLQSSSPFQSDVDSPKSGAEIQSSPFQSDVESSPFQSNVSSSPFQSNVDSSPFEIIVDDSPLPRRSTVRWAQHAGTKSFYFDEKVSEMLDSSLETITSSPLRWDDVNNDADDSLDESQLSIELLENLQDDAAKKLELASSAAVSPKPLVTPLDSQEMDTLNRVAEASEHGHIADFPIVGDKLTAKDFATLLPELFNGDPRAWLNDEIVNDYLAILINYKKTEAGFVKQKGGPAPPVHAFSSFWYTQIQTKKESVKRWAFRAQLEGAQYLDAALILYPICDRGHWRLLVVKPQERTIEYLDSFGFSGQSYIETLMEYLEMELEDAFIADEWTVIEGQRSTRQANGSDCGVFTLLNALALLRGEDANRVIACNGMVDARERIATTLMQRKPTTEME